MARAIELASLVGVERVDAALGLAAIHGRFGESDLASICDHLARSSATGPTSMADEKHSAQPGTASWAAIRATPQNRKNED